MLIADGDDGRRCSYIVSVPEVEGVDTDPDPGKYEVDAWDSFIMEQKLDSAYNQSLPVVTTSRGESSMHAPSPPAIAALG